MLTVDATGEVHYAAVVAPVEEAPPTPPPTPPPAVAVAPPLGHRHISAGRIIAWYNHWAERLRRWRRTNVVRKSEPIVVPPDPAPAVLIAAVPLLGTRHIAAGRIAAWYRRWAAEGPVDDGTGAAARRIQAAARGWRVRRRARRAAEAARRLRALRETAARRVQRWQRLCRWRRTYFGAAQLIGRAMRRRLAWRRLWRAGMKRRGEGRFWRRLSRWGGPPSRPPPPVVSLKRKPPSYKARPVVLPCHRCKGNAVCVCDFDKPMDMTPPPPEKSTAIRDFLAKSKLPVGAAVAVAKKKRRAKAKRPRPRTAPAARRRGSVATLRRAAQDNRAPGEAWGEATLAAAVDGGAEDDAKVAAGGLVAKGWRALDDHHDLGPAEEHDLMHRGLATTAKPFAFMLSDARLDVEASLPWQTATITETDTGKQGTQINWAFICAPQRPVFVEHSEKWRLEH